MLDRNQDDGERHSLLKLLLNVANRVAETRGAIRQKGLEAIFWHDNHADVNVPDLEAVPEMHDVTDKEITPGGHLNLDPDPCNDALVLPNPLDPIYPARCGLHPIGTGGEASVECFPNRACPVSLTLLCDLDPRVEENLL